MKKVECIKVYYTAVLQWRCDGNMMILNYRRQCIVTTLLLIPAVDLQMLFPMAPMPPPMFAYPPPPPPAVAMAFPPSPPIAFQIVQIKTRRTTTESPTGTAEKNVKDGENENNTQKDKIRGGNDDKHFEKTIGIAIPMAFPGPVQIALPNFQPPLPPIIVASSACMQTPRPSNCPVCPPCSCIPCTPSHFANCSACHKKCRCHNKKKTTKKRLKISRKKHTAHSKRTARVFPTVDYSHEDSDSSNDYSLDSFDYFDSGSFERTFVKKFFKKKKAGYSRRKPYFRKGNFDSEMSDDFAKPILSYISNDGIVKLEKLLSEADAAELMDENTTEKSDTGTKVYQKVQVIADEDDGKVKRVKVISNVDDDFKFRSENNPDKHLRSHKKLKLEHLLGEGKKELLFTPSNNKKISNVSLSFQVA